VLSSSWDGRPFGHNRHGPKIGGLCDQRWGLPPYQMASWSIKPFGHNRHGPKIGGCAPLGQGELGPHLTQSGRGRGLPLCQVSCWSILPFCHNTATSQTGQTDRQRTDRIGRTILQTVNQKWITKKYLSFILSFNSLLSVDIMYIMQSVEVYAVLKVYKWWYSHQSSFTIITFRVRCSWGEMYIGHRRLCACPSPHFHTTAWTRMLL